MIDVLLDVDVKGRGKISKGESKTNPTHVLSEDR
jgi:hypothetical protein